MVNNLKEYARKLVERKSREQAGRVLILMKDRFSTIFNHDKDSIPRLWTGKEDIRAITKEAQHECLMILSTMAVIRLDEEIDDVENALLSILMDNGDPLALSTWEKVPQEKTLITPVQCKALWKRFKSETEHIINQAISALVAYKQSNNWLPPPWAILAMIVLGFNEFVLLLRNPLYFIGLFVLYLVGKATWVQIDIPSLLQNGFVGNLMTLSTMYFNRSYRQHESVS